MSRAPTAAKINGIRLSASSGDCSNNMVASNGYDHNTADHMTHGSSGAVAPVTNGNTAGSKFSKIGRRIRDSCRNFRGKHPSGGASSNPEDYTSEHAPNESMKSMHYAAMDFTGKTGRIISHKDLPGQPTKDGYTYFRRKIEPTNVDHLLTETQANIHKDQPWFHKGVGREVAQRILASHLTDGLFLVRESSMAGGFVISYYFGGRAYHVPIMPVESASGEAVTYSLDESRTKFFDLLQLVEFYQLNKGSLHTKLTHFVVCCHERAESPTDSSSSCRNASDGSLDSQISGGGGGKVSNAGSNSVTLAASSEVVSMTSSTTSSSCTKMDSNHNTAKNEGACKSAGGAVNAESSEDDEHSVATAVDAAMVSEEESAAEEERDLQADDQLTMKH